MSSRLAGEIDSASRAVGFLGALPGILSDMETLINAIKNGNSFWQELNNEYKNQGDIIMGPGFLMPNPWKSPSRCNLPEA